MCYYGFMPLQGQGGARFDPELTPTQTVALLKAFLLKNSGTTVASFPPAVGASLIDDIYQS